MRLIIEQSDLPGEAEIVIRCGPVIDGRLQRLIEEIRLYSFAVTARRDGSVYQVEPRDIYYFESVDEKTFLYLEKEVYQCDSRLYELEEQLAGSTFVRVNKQTILNIGHLESVRPLLNGKLEARMENGERLFVSRHYVPEFRKRFGV